MLALCSKPDSPAFCSGRFLYCFRFKVGQSCFCSEKSPDCFWFKSGQSCLRRRGSRVLVQIWTVLLEVDGPPSFLGSKQDSPACGGWSPDFLGVQTWTVLLVEDGLSAFGSKQDSPACGGWFLYRFMFKTRQFCLRRMISDCFGFKAGQSCLWWKISRLFWGAKRDSPACGGETLDFWFKTGQSCFCSEKSPECFWFKSGQSCLRRRDSRLLVQNGTVLLLQ